MLTDESTKLAQRAQSLMAEGRWLEAAELPSTTSELLVTRGKALLGLRRDAEGLDCFERSLSTAPRAPAALQGKCLALARLGRSDTALAVLDQWLLEDPQCTDTDGVQAQVLLVAGRREEAWKAAVRGCERHPQDPAALLVRGLLILEQSSDPSAALAAFDRAIALAPTLAAAHQGRGNALVLLSRTEHAFEAFESAARLDPNNALVSVRLGHLLTESNRFERALQAYERALGIRDRDTEALQGRAQCLAALGRAAEAVEAYTRLLETAPAADYMYGERFHLQARCCDWREYDTRRLDLAARVRRGERADVPSCFMAHTDSPADQLLCARTFTADVCHSENISPRHRADGKRIRVAYLSAGSGSGATAHLAALLEAHDRSKFEIYAFLFGADDGGVPRMRFAESCDHFEDVRQLTDRQIAERVSDCGIDIAVDLDGHKVGARPQIFAFRPSAIQVSFLGYPGSLGAEFMDYVVADRVVIPETERHHYAERVIYLPGSCQLNDVVRGAKPRPTRGEAGLPPSGFVFCCFGRTHKITPAIFDDWMHILSAVPDSLLWLSETTSTAMDNLRAVALRRGIDASRLIFAPWMTDADHLARCALVDVFLDTAPYNAGSSASNALWAGVPVITRTGSSFASRVTASLLRAVCLSDLSVDTSIEYRRLAIRLAEAPAELESWRAVLAMERERSTLFNPARYCRQLEAAFGELIARSRRGETPSFIELPEVSISAQAARAGTADAWLSLADAQQQSGAHEEAIDSYGKALSLDPDSFYALNNLGHSLRVLRRTDQALAAFERALELQPSYMAALNNRGLALMDMQRLPQALMSFNEALRVQPNSPEVLSNRGTALVASGNFREAAGTFTQLVALAPALGAAAGSLLYARRHGCDWSDYQELAQRVVAAVDRGEVADQPLSFLCLSDSAASQLRCAQTFSATHFPSQSALGPAPGRRPRGSHDRIRVAYLSGDFGEHALSYLLAGVIEQHDRSRFDTVAVAWGRREDGAMRARLESAFESFIDATDWSDGDIVSRLRKMNVDVAVDLAGHTSGQRTGVFTRRAAPVQVNYLGFPATMGVPEMDYILADEFLIPPEHQANYSERVVYLPECFQANDDRRLIDPEAPTRARAGLPEDGFVWCSFHGSHKFNPSMFDVWARLVHGAPGSVLWLIGGDSAIEANLRREALLRGIDPQRLIFAPRLPYPSHLARLRLADLCLDTLPFNGGATTSDALWAGVPVVTCAGGSFAARMSGSLLHALGLAELVTHSMGEYELLASRLASQPERLTQLRGQLASGRSSSPLFDTARFCRHLEAAYTAVLDRHAQGLTPVTMKIAALGK